MPDKPKHTETNNHKKQNIMKKLLGFATVALFCMFATACDEPESEDYELKFISVPAQTTLDAGATSLSQGITFRASSDWSAYAELDALTVNSAKNPNFDFTEVWISVSPESGKAGDNTIEVSLLPNTWGIERSANIIILCQDEKLTLHIVQKAENSGDDPVPDKLQIRRITVSSYGDNVSMDFQYDEQGRIVAVKSADGNDTCEGVLKYTPNSVEYTLTYTEEGERYTERSVAALDAQGRIEKIDWYEDGVYDQTLNLSYDNLGFLTTRTMVKEQEEDTVKLEWTNGCITSYDWSYKYFSTINGETGTMTYTRYPATTNLDLNWLLYQTEGLAFIASGDDDFCLYQIQGLCGNRSEYYIDNMKYAYKSTDSGEQSREHECVYKYDFDPVLGVPTRITATTTSYTPEGSYTNDCVFHIDY